MAHVSDAIVQITTPVRAHYADGERAATGFWYRCGDGPPVLITAAHGVSGATQVQCYQGGWHDAQVVWRHDRVDLAALACGARAGAWLERAWIPSERDWAALPAVTPVLVPGHPLGLADEVHGRPIVRSGVTATDPRLPWGGRAEFLVDLPVYPGSSGSPVLRYDPAASVPLALLGVVVGGPSLREEARVGVLGDWPRGDTFHLGVVADARHLLGLTR